MMKYDYTDIIDKIEEEPQWYDKSGVPRYKKFEPTDIYDMEEIVLLVIECQYCQRKFTVANSAGLADTRSLMQYGDPPFHNCTGDSMTSQHVSIKEWWIRNHSSNFQARTSWSRKKITGKKLNRVESKMA